MKIAVICPGSFTADSDRSSSVERVCCEMSKRLPEHFSVTIYSKRSGHASAYEHHGMLIHRRFRAAKRSEYVRQVIRSLRRRRPDVIQIENRPLLVRRLRRNFPNIPIILSLHSTTFVNPRKYPRRIIAQSLKRANGIVVNSEFLAGWLQRNMGVPRQRIAVCYPGTDIERFISRYQPTGRELREVMREELGYADKKVVLFIGRLIPMKGVHHLLAAFRRVIAKHQDAVLLICGSAKYGSDRLTSYVKQLHQIGGTMPNHVRFVPFIPHSSAPSWYLAADVVVVPSTGEEAFGLVNVEAAACGAPVVATRVGGIAEVIRHNVNGLLVNPDHIQEELAEALNELLEDQGWGTRMGKEAVAIACHQFSWQMTASRYAAIYEKLVTTNRE